MGYGLWVMGYGLWVMGYGQKYKIYGYANLLKKPHPTPLQGIGS
jgi:hypothetical protein